MITALRSVWADLVEKRLWPLAVALMLALVAVPVVLARGGGSASVPPPAVPAAAAGAAARTPAATPVRIVDPTTHARPRGRYHDPFAGSAPPKASSAAGSSTPAPSSAPSGGASSASSSPASPSPASPSAPAAAATPSPAVSAPVASPGPSSRQAQLPGYAAGYRLDVGFGPAGDVHATKDLVRLGALRADRAPLAIFLGVRRDGRTAMFLLPAGATSTGDGRCFPTRTTCQLIELRKDESEFFDVPSGASGVVQYELDVNRVSVRRAATHAAALRAQRHVSTAGRKAMFDVIRSGRTYVTRWMYSTVRGVLFMPHRTQKSSPLTP